MKRLTIASIQPPEFVAAESIESHEKTISIGFELLGEAMSRKASLCILPEYFNVYNAPPKQWVQLSDNADVLIQKVSKLAGESGSAVVLPLLVNVDGVFRNRALAIDGDGSVVGHYDKIHPTIAEKEQLGVVPGDEVKTFEMSFGRLAIAICYDVYFPRYFSELQNLQADVIAMPSLQRSESEIAS
ncbi:MAG: hypothetical protein PHT84_05640, partial [Candidatus Pacebacteria bacterium]|nr:hypothetical protein [Candidatus Paceibacterota bacterium]